MVGGSAVNYWLRRDPIGLRYSLLSFININPYLRSLLVYPIGPFGPIPPVPAATAGSRGFGRWHGTGNHTPFDATPTSGCSSLGA